MKGTKKAKVVITVPTVYVKSLDEFKLQGNTFDIPADEAATLVSQEKARYATKRKK